MTTTTPTPSALRPTHIRYVIVGVAMLAALLLYLERVCISVADVIGMFFLYVLAPGDLRPGLPCRLGGLTPLRAIGEPTPWRPTFGFLPCMVLLAPFLLLLSLPVSSSPCGRAAETAARSCNRCVSYSDSEDRLPEVPCIAGVDVDFLIRLS